MIKHKSQRNVAYRPVFVVHVRWTWRGTTHYLSLGNEGDCPPFPEGR